MFGAVRHWLVFFGVRLLVFGCMLDYLFGMVLIGLDRRKACYCCGSFGMCYVGRDHVFGVDWVLVGSCRGIGVDFDMVAGIVVNEEFVDMIVDMVVVGSLIVGNGVVDMVVDITLSFMYEKNEKLFKYRCKKYFSG